jgi:uncharacterized oxidoreductase
MVESALRGPAKDKAEILPGAAKVLKLMGRVAPKFFFNRLNDVFARMVAKPAKP